MTTPEFSLIVATLGRSQELVRLLESLDRQTFRSFETVIVDQNADDRVARAIETANTNLAVRHLRSTQRGVCYNRNRGAREARGPWLLFPDDDSWYPPDFLAAVDRLRCRHAVEMLSGRPTDEAGRTINGTFTMRAGPHTRSRVWHTLIEWVFAIRRDLFERIGGFDERIGPGSGFPFGSCEIQDLVLRALQAGGRGHYDPQLTGHHAQWDLSDPTRADLEKLQSYAVGFGYVLRKNGYSHADLAYWLGRPLIGAGLNVARGRTALAKQGLLKVTGRWRGWRRGPG